jgi:hypothetical protein
VTSWKTGRGKAARGFLKESVFYERDDRRGSVVIGPSENVVWLNKIQEFGGSRSVAFRLVSRRPIEKLKSGQKVPTGMGLKTGSQRRTKRGRFARGRNAEAYVVMRRDAATGKRTPGGTYKTEPGRVKSGKYMANGLRKTRQRIPKAFQNFVSGP